MGTITGVDSEIKWINSIGEIPIIGGVFAFILIFIIPVLCSFASQQLIPGLSDELGFTKAMLVLLPTWNLFLWLIKIRTKTFFLPAWIFLGTIAILKIIFQFNEIYG